MARISIVICASHSPFLYVDPQDWAPAAEVRRANGGISPETPVDSPEENEAKHARCLAAFGVLRTKLEAAKPDVLLIFGDDQLEQFDFRNFPALCIFVGERFGGYKVSPYVGLPVGRKRALRERTPEHWAEAPGHPALAQRLAVGLVERGFDFAFSNAIDEASGIGHAFMRPLKYLRPDYDLPTVPIFINCYYGPQPTARRCWELGRAVREVITVWDSDLTVGIIGSGGLWHTPNEPNAHIDPTFDAIMLDAVRRGDAAAMAAELDRRRADIDPSDPVALKNASGGTGMLSGVGNGTGETRNWIAAAATVDGIAGTVVDYVPVNASPIGAGFAYWDLADEGKQT